ncbi:MAG: MFS transporter [Candidatus Heimdallarchaeota archaeon]|nr:MFS transporter [Candidatus Heimdallarchaeota archaeon]
MQVFLSFGQNLAFQFLPIYTRKLGGTERQMGLLTAVQNVFSNLFSPYWGKKSDQMGRRIFMVFGGFIAFSCAIAMALANNPNQIIVTVAVNSFGMSILVPAWSGAIADYTKGMNRGSFMSKIMGIGAGYVSIALIIYAYYIPKLNLDEISQYRVIIWASAINFGLATVVSGFIVDRNEKEKREFKLFLPLKDSKFRRYTFITITWWFFMSLAWSYFPILISDVVNASSSEVALIGLTQTIVQSIVGYKLGKYIEKLGMRKSIIIGLLPFALIPLIFSFATVWWHLIPAQIIAGFSIGFGFAAMEGYILEIAGNQNAGSYKGVYQVIWGFVTFIGSFLGGILLEWLSHYLGNLTDALRIMLFTVFLARLVVNLFMIKLLPDI